MEKGLPKPGFARVLGERDREKNERTRGRFLLALNGSEDNSSNRTGLGKRGGKKKEKGKNYALTHIYTLQKSERKSLSPFFVSRKYCFTEHFFLHLFFF